MQNIFNYLVKYSKYLKLIYIAISDVCNFKQRFDTCSIKSKYCLNVNRHRYTSGFSMVESLVAIAVLLIAIVGPLTIAINSIQYSNVAKDKLQATYLAQEQLELIVARQHSIFIECYIGVPTLDINGDIYNATRYNCTTTKDDTVNSNSLGVSVVSVDLAVKGQAFKDFYNELVVNGCTSDKCYIDSSTFDDYAFNSTSYTAYTHKGKNGECELYTHDSTSNITYPLFMCNRDTALGWTKTKFTRKLTAARVLNSVDASGLTDYKKGLNNIASTDTIEKQDQIMLTSSVTYTIFGIPRTVSLNLLVSMIQ